MAGSVARNPLAPSNISKLCPVARSRCWVRHRRLVQSSPALLVRGRLETAEGVTNVVAERISLLPLSASLPSRDFR